MPDDTPLATRPFVPRFGPNGAVINSPDMTDNMRAEIEKSPDLPKGRLRAKIIKDLPALSVYLAALLLGWFLAVRMNEEGNFIGGMAVQFVGVPVGFFAVMLLLAFAMTKLRHWEIAGVPAAERELAAPFALRLGLAVAEIVFAFSVFVALPFAVLSRDWSLAAMGVIVVGWLGQFGLSRLTQAREWRREI